VVAPAPLGFAEFVAARSGVLVHSAFLLTGDHHLAQDLVQAALVRTWPHWERIQDGHPEAYVRTVMVRLQNSWWRRKWRGEIPTEILPEPRRTSASLAGSGVTALDGRSTQEQVEDNLVLAAALAGLPRGQRQVVVLRYVDDLSVEEVASILGCSAGTVKSQGARGLDKLRQALIEPVGPAEPSGLRESGAPMREGE